MGKSLKNIVKNEGLFILLSIVNIYIIPFVLYKVYCDEEIWYHAEYDFCIFLFGMFGLWLCGIGGVIQIILGLPAAVIDVITGYYWRIMKADKK